jgi:hypothetical protein
MSNLTVGWMIDVVEKKILEESNIDFSEAELVGLYNLTLRLIVSLVPRAYTKTESWIMAAGILQSIPSDGMRLVDVYLNMGDDGETPGSPITEADQDSMREMVPGWATETATSEIEHFMRIPNMDASFNCYPPSDGTGYIQGVFSATPPTVVYDEEDVWKSERIPISDEFVNAIPDGIMFHAYDDDSDIPGNTTRSQIHYQRLLSILGLDSPKMRQAAAAAAQGRPQ